MGVLDPVDLRELACHLRDGTWLDLRVVEHGTVERARVTGIIVRADHEELELEQEHSFNGEVQTSVLNYPADSVRWARPSVFSLEDVEIRHPKATDASVDDQRVIDAAKDLLIFLFKDSQWTPLKNRKDVEKLMVASPYGGTGCHARHVFVWTVWRFGSGEISPTDICKMAGYKSPMPLQSARWKFSDRRDDYKDDMAAIDKAMAARGFKPVRGDGI